MKNTILFFVFILFGTILRPQQLTKQQMYADFDTLICIMKECNPQLPFKKIVTNFDQLESVKELRPQIEQITDANNFRRFLNRCIGYMYDYHTSEANSIYNTDNLEGIDTNFGSVEIDVMARLHYFPGNPIYHGGQYSVFGNYQCISIETNDTIFLSTPQILSYKGKAYSKFIKDNLYG